MLWTFSDFDAGQEAEQAIVTVESEVETGGPCGLGWRSMCKSASSIGIYSNIYRILLCRSVTLSAQIILSVEPQ